MHRFLLFLCWIPCQTNAAEQDNVVLLPDIQAFDILKMLMALALVIAIFLACIWMIRKLGQLQPQGGRVMQVVGGVSLGSKERLLLVQVGAEQIVVGVAPGRVEKIHVMTQPVPLPEREPIEVPNFLKCFKAQLKDRNRG